MPGKSEIKKFQKKILDWYEENKQDYPWRSLPFDLKLKERDPYRILISEVMLQQTQVNRVISKYNVWIEKFPSVQDLVRAKVPDVLAAWSGLGYNRRALHLKKTAEIVIKDYGGVFPRDELLLKKLPGIGTYTARALLCFAFNNQIAVVDTNIRKVILTQFLGYQFKKSDDSYLQLSNRTVEDTSFKAQKDSRFTEKFIQEIAERLLPQGKAYEWNQALMDYSREMLREHKIPVPKQSKFAGSRRYYRGQILKLLLEKNTIPINEIGFYIKKGYSEADKAWLQSLLDELVREGFIISKNGSISFPTE